MIRRNGEMAEVREGGCAGGLSECFARANQRRQRARPNGDVAEDRLVFGTQGDIKCGYEF